MKNDNVVPLSNPVFADALSDLLQQNAHKLIYEAVESELAEFMNQHQTIDPQSKKVTLVRNGYLPKREILTGIGSVPIEVPRIRDRSGSGKVFHSSLLPPYLKKTQRLTQVIPWLYLTGVSTGQFNVALKALFGQTVKGLSSNTISRLKRVWEADYESWCTSSLKGRKFVYLWADGIHLKARLEDSKQCVLVIIGVDEQGKKHFLAIEDGVRESTLSWRSVLLSLKQRGLKTSPKLAVGDGALGFWHALSEVYPDTKHQRCWVHKTANILNKLPKGLQAKAKSQIQAIWMAATRQEAQRALNHFCLVYRDKYPKAVQCLEKDEEALLAFYDFPAAHWQHLRTSNPIESSFATIRLRTKKTKGCLSRKSGLAMVYQLAMLAEKNWRRLRGFNKLADVINGVKFIDGIDQRTIQSQQKDVA